MPGDLFTQTANHSEKTTGLLVIYEKTKASTDDPVISKYTR